MTVNAVFSQSDDNQVRPNRIKLMQSLLTRCFKTGAFGIALRQQMIPDLIVEMQIKQRAIHVEDTRVDGVPVNNGGGRWHYSQISPNFSQRRRHL